METIFAEEIKKLGWEELEKDNDYRRFFHNQKKISLSFSSEETEAEILETLKYLTKNKEVSNVSEVRPFVKRAIKADEIL